MPPIAGPTSGGRRARGVVRLRSPRRAGYQQRDEGAGRPDGGSQWRRTATRRSVPASRPLSRKQRRTWRGVGRARPQTTIRFQWPRTSRETMLPPSGRQRAHDRRRLVDRVRDDDAVGPQPPADQAVAFAEQPVRLADAARGPDEEVLHDQVEAPPLAPQVDAARRPRHQLDPQLVEAEVPPGGPQHLAVELDAHDLGRGGRAHGARVRRCRRPAPAAARAAAGAAAAAPARPAPTRRRPSATGRADRPRRACRRRAARGRPVRAAPRPSGDARSPAALGRRGGRTRLVTAGAAARRPRHRARAPAAAAPAESTACVVRR